MTTLSFGRRESVGRLPVGLAGGVAEMLYYGGKSRGMVRDLTQLTACQMIPVPGTVAVTAEVAGRFPATRHLLRHYWTALLAIGRTAYRRFYEMNLATKHFEPVQVLTAAEVQQLVESHPA